MNLSTENTHRYFVLDSLRGLAALSVLLTHILQKIVPPGVLSHTPVRLLVDGRCFVIFFFVLSGFVLATALWTENAKSGYAGYALRRLVRLYPPYAAAGILAVALIWLSNRQLDPAQLMDYLLALGTTQGITLNRPSWSLTYELRLSLLMPLFCFLIGRNIRVFAMAVAFAFVAVEIAIMRLDIGQFPYAVDSVLPAVIVTLRFAICFALGAMLAWLHRWRPSFFPLVERYPYAVALLACILMSVLLDQTSMAGAALVIVLALKWPKMQTFMAFRPFVWLGRVSYSLYLTHFIILEFVSVTLGSRLPPLAVAALAFAAAFVVAEVFYRLVEAPSIMLSRRIGSALRARPLSVAPN